MKIATRYISVWLDETSEPGIASWIVSRENGCTETTETLAVFDAEERANAIAEGERIAKAESLELVIEP